MGRLTTHVLDTAHGKPAAAMKLALFRVDGQGTTQEICQRETNKDGRTDEPLLEGEHLLAGTYELIFEVAPYFKKSGAVVADPPFLDRVTLRFTVADPAAHYHVPLLVSPWAYSTYRGS